MERMAGVLGKPEDARLYASKKQQLQEKVHETFFDETTNTYGTGTQIDLAFPMIAGAVPDDKLDAVENSLYHETEVNRNGHLATGLVGLPVLTEWVVENSEVDLMYSMLKKRDYPGYLYMIDNGATTTWEHWDGARSHIHNCYNGIGSWFYQAVGGIRPVENVPAYRKVRIEPQIPDGVTWASTSQETPFGKLVVNWNLDGEILNLDIEIPVGVEAEVFIPASAKTYKLNDIEYELSGSEENAVGLKSGKYKVSYKRS
jgi:alpha-L-rhamnosidase